MSFSVIMKCTCALRQLAFGIHADALDEYLQIGEHCARDCLDFFTTCIIQLYGKEFLRKPSETDIHNGNNFNKIGIINSVSFFFFSYRFFSSYCNFFNLMK